MKNDELKEELKKRCLSRSGLNKALQERLKQAMVDRVPIVEEASTETPKQNSVFCEGARWEKLQQNLLPHEYPLKKHLREPTMGRELEDLVHDPLVEKFDSIDTFDPPPF